MVLITANTYDWIIATADSKTDNAICVITKIVNKDVDRKGPVFPNRVNNKCPLIIQWKIVFIVFTILNILSFINPRTTTQSRVWPAYKQHSAHEPFEECNLILRLPLYLRMLLKGVFFYVTRSSHLGWPSVVISERDFFQR